MIRKVKQGVGKVCFPPAESDMCYTIFSKGHEGPSWVREATTAKEKVHHEMTKCTLGV